MNLDSFSQSLHDQLTVKRDFLDDEWQQDLQLIHLGGSDSHTLRSLLRKRIERLFERRVSLSLEQIRLCLAIEIARSRMDWLVDNYIHVFRDEFRQHMAMVAALGEAEQEESSNDGDHEHHNSSGAASTEDSTLSFKQFEQLVGDATTQHQLAEKVLLLARENESDSASLIAWLQQRLDALLAEVMQFELRTGERLQTPVDRLDDGRLEIELELEIVDQHREILEEQQQLLARTTKLSNINNNNNGSASAQEASLSPSSSPLFVSSEDELSEKRKQDDEVDSAQKQLNLLRATVPDQMRQRASLLRNEIGLLKLKQDVALLTYSPLKERAYALRQKLRSIEMSVAEAERERDASLLVAAEAERQIQARAAIAAGKKREESSPSDAVSPAPVAAADVETHEQQQQQQQQQQQDDPVQAVQQLVEQQQANGSSAIAIAQQSLQRDGIGKVYCSVIVDALKFVHANKTDELRVQLILAQQKAAGAAADSPGNEVEGDDDGADTQQQQRQIEQQLVGDLISGREKSRRAAREAEFRMHAQTGTQIVHLSEGLALVEQRRTAARQDLIALEKVRCGMIKEIARCNHTAEALTLSATDVARLLSYVLPLRRSWIVSSIEELGRRVRADTHMVARERASQEARLMGKVAATSEALHRLRLVTETGLLACSSWQAKKRQKEAESLFQVAQAASSEAQAVLDVLRKRSELVGEVVMAAFSDKWIAPTVPEPEPVAVVVEPPAAQLSMVQQPRVVALPVVHEIDPLL